MSTGYRAKGEAVEEEEPKESAGLDLEGEFWLPMSESSQKVASKYGRVLLRRDDPFAALGSLRVVAYDNGAPIEISYGVIFTDAAGGVHRVDHIRGPEIMPQDPTDCRSIRAFSLRVVGLQKYGFRYTGIVSFPNNRWRQDKFEASDGNWVGRFPKDDPSEQWLSQLNITLFRKA